MAVIKGMLKANTKILIPSKILDDEDEAGEFVADIVYEAVEKTNKAQNVELFLESGASFNVGSDYVEADFKVGGFSPREANANEQIADFLANLKALVSKKVAKGVSIGSTFKQGYLYVLIGDKSIMSGDYKSNLIQCRRGVAKRKFLKAKNGYSDGLRKDGSDTEHLVYKLEREGFSEAVIGQVDSFVNSQVNLLVKWVENMVDVEFRSAIVTNIAKVRKGSIEGLAINWELTNPMSSIEFKTFSSDVERLTRANPFKNEVAGVWFEDIRVKAVSDSEVAVVFDLGFSPVGGIKSKQIRSKRLTRRIKSKARLKSANENSTAAARIAKLAQKEFSMWEPDYRGMGGIYEIASGVYELELGCDGLVFEADNFDIKELRKMERPVANFVKKYRQKLIDTFNEFIGDPVTAYDVKVGEFKFDDSLDTIYGTVVFTILFEVE